MIRLDTTTRKLQIILAGAITTNQLPVLVCWSDKTSSSYSGGSTPSNTNSGTAVDICAAPAASTVRDIDSITVQNADTASATATIRYNDNGTTYTLFKATLAVGDQLIYTHGQGWKVLDSSGNLKSAGGGAGSGTVTTVSVVSANGLAGTVANATTTPAITLSTSITGILKGNGTAISAASAGTDYASPGANSDITSMSALTSVSTAAGVAIHGTNTNDSASAGYVGEYVSSNLTSGSAVSLTTSTAANITSISLTAGDWTVSGSVVFSLGGGVTCTFLADWVSTVSASLPTAPNLGSEFALQTTLSGATNQCFPTGTSRISVASTTTVYLSAQANFSGGTMSAYGFIGARRER